MDNDSDYALLDEAGEPVDPASEGSFLMAVDFHHQRSASNLDDAGNGATPSNPLERHSSSTTASRLKWDRLSTELRRALSSEAVACETDTTPLVVASNAHVSGNNRGSGSDVCQNGTCEANGGDLDVVEHDSDEEWCGSREHTDEEEWILECIVRRRQPKRGLGAATTASRSRGGNSDLDDDHTARDGNVSWEYLCKWKWYAQPTWEPRDVLDDQGYGVVVNVFDAQFRAAADAVRGVGRGKWSLPLHQHVFNEVMPLVLSRFRESSMRVLRYAPIVNRTLEAAFVNVWREECAKQPKFLPLVVFHGTRWRNFPSISIRGLKIPGSRSGVRMANGCAFGEGVYSARSPSYSSSYCDCDLMFACLALPATPTDHTSSKEGGESSLQPEPRYFANDEIVVLFEEHLIVPIWVVQFQWSFSVRDVEGSVGAAAAAEPEAVSFGDLVHGVYGRTWFDDDHPSVPPMAVPPYNGPAGHIDGVKSVAHSFTKRMIKQLPRSMKEAYRAGNLRAKRTS